MPLDSRQRYRDRGTSHPVWVRADTTSPHLGTRSPAGSPDEVWFHQLSLKLSGKPAIGIGVELNSAPENM